MPRKTQPGPQKGTLVETAEGFVARIWLTREGGKFRRVVDLGTKDSNAARQRMDEILRRLREECRVTERMASAPRPGASTSP